LNAKISHIGFADESYWNTGRFRSLGLVTTSLVKDNYLKLEDNLSELLHKSGIQEFKWKNLRRCKERFAAIEMSRFAIENALAGKLRVDVLIWDTHDSRHDVPGRDDIANLQRMYYHLFLNVLRARWPNNAIWRLHPDEHTALNWETVRDFLEANNTNFEVVNSLFSAEGFKLRLRQEFAIEEIQQVSSEEYHLLQLADFFAGLAVFSRDKFDEYLNWLQVNSLNPSLFGKEEATREPSGSEKERFQVLKWFDDACKQSQLGVSLKTKRGLWTPDPRNPINFWLYKPQHPEDKAPHKAKR